MEHVEKRFEERFAKRTFHGKVYTFGRDEVMEFARQELRRRDDEVIRILHENAVHIASIAWPGQGLVPLVNVNEMAQECLEDNNN